MNKNNGNFVKICVQCLNFSQVNTETWVIEKKANQTEQEPVPLKWAWRHENIDDTVIKGKGDKSASKLMDQKAANDVSDYLWYMTRYISIYVITL